MPETRWVRFCAVMVGLGLAAATTLLATPAHAATEHYVALGDSYSSGVGADAYYPASGACLRGANAYPVLWARSHAPSTFDFPACAGATTADVRSSQLRVLNAGTTLVTISVGGNDVGFVNVVTTCKLGSTSACATAVSGAVQMGQTTLPDLLSATYAEIKAAAPHARLVVLGYPRLFETGPSCGVLGMSQANRVALNNGADALEAVIQSRAEAAGARYISLQSAFGGHRICAPDPWINGTVALVLNSYHPKAAGYSQGYLQALTAVTG